MGSIEKYLFKKCINAKKGICKIPSYLYKYFWFLLAIALFLGGIFFVNSFLNSLEPKNLPINILFPLYSTNITNYLICERGLHYPDVAVREDTLLCHMEVNTLPKNVSIYKIGLHQVVPSTPKYKLYRTTNFSFYGKIDQVHKSKHNYLEMPDSPSVGFSISIVYIQNGKEENTYETSPIWLNLYSKEYINQTKITIMMILIPSIIALLGIFPAIKSLRDLKPKKEKVSKTVKKPAIKKTTKVKKTGWKME